MTQEPQYTPYRTTYYGIMHVPLMVTPVPSRRQKGAVVAFIGKQLCLFERGTPIPPVGVPVEVMITRSIFGRLGPNDPGPEPIKREDGSLQYGFDYKRLSSVLIEVVDPVKHMLVAIDGFECSGTMCRTTAHGVETDGSRPITLEEAHPPKLKNESAHQWIDRTRHIKNMWLTPGRSDIFVASNVNAGTTWNVPYTAKRPTNVYVERRIVEEKAGCGVRIAGLTRVKDSEYSHLYKV